MMEQTQNPCVKRRKPNNRNSYDSNLNPFLLSSSSSHFTLEQKEVCRLNRANRKKILCRERIKKPTYRRRNSHTATDTNTTQVHTTWTPPFHEQAYCVDSFNQIDLPKPNENNMPLPNHDESKSNRAKRKEIICRQKAKHTTLTTNNLTVK